MNAYQKRKVFYSAGLAAALYVIFSLLVGAQWVFDVFLFLNHRTISMDTDKDGKDDYWEHWEKGVLVLTEWDLNQDGIPDFVNQYQDDQVVVILQDADFDGYFEYRETWADDGSQVLELDEDRDGIFIRIDLHREREDEDDP